MSGADPAAPTATGSGSAAGYVVALLFVAALALVPFVGGAYLTTITFSFLIAYVVAQSWH